MQEKQIGVAIIGIGEYAEMQIMPALQESQKCKLAAVITSDDKDKKEAAEKMKLREDQVYYYRELEQIKDNNEIDVVYIIVPNKFHRKYCEEIAALGKHVLCEKPLAVSSEDCRAMIDACKKHNVKLFVGYRLHFNVHHRLLIDLCRRQHYGKILEVNSCNGFHLTQANDWRLDHETAGGGSMMDMGIYIINEYNQLFEQLPLRVKAKKIRQRPEMFKEVEESLEWEMIYEDGMKAKGYCSYYDDVSELNIVCERATLQLRNAYKYDGLELLVDGEPLKYKEEDHKVTMLDHMAQCIEQGKCSYIEAEEALEDIEVIEAVYKSMDSGKEEHVEQQINFGTMIEHA